MGHYEINIMIASLVIVSFWTHMGFNFFAVWHRFGVM